MPRAPLLLLAFATPAAAQPRLLGLTAEGGDFRADLSDGTHLRGAGWAFAGALPGRLHQHAARRLWRGGTRLDAGWHVD